MSDLTTPAGRQQATLFREAQRTVSESVGAAKLYAHLRGRTGFADQVKALEFLNGLERAAAEAKAKWEAACGPVVYCLPAQRETIVRLLNHPSIEPGERTLGLLELPRLSTETAAAVIIGLKLDINARFGSVVFPEVLGYTVVAGEVVEAQYGVVGSAEVVTAKEAA